MECNHEITQEKLDLIRERGIHQIEVLFIDESQHAVDLIDHGLHLGRDLLDVFGDRDLKRLAGTRLLQGEVDARKKALDRVPFEERGAGEAGGRAESAEADRIFIDTGVVPERADERTVAQREVVHGLAADAEILIVPNEVHVRQRHVADVFEVHSDSGRRAVGTRRQRGARQGVRRRVRGVRDAGVAPTGS